MGITNSEQCFANSEQRFANSEQCFANSEFGTVLRKFGIRNSEFGISGPAVGIIFEVSTHRKYNQDTKCLPTVSLFTIHYSLFIIHYSLLRFTSYKVGIRRCGKTKYDQDTKCLPTVSLFTIHYSLFIIHSSLLLTKRNPAFYIIKKRCKPVLRPACTFIEFNISAYFLAVIFLIPSNVATIRTAPMGRAIYH